MGAPVMGAPVSGAPVHKDPAAPVLAGLLALLALPVTGLVPPGPLASTPGAFLHAATLLSALFLVAVGPHPRDEAARPALRPVTLVLASAPFLAFGLLASPRAGDDLVLPGIGWAACFGLATLLGGLAPHVRRLLSGVLVAVLGAGAVLSTAGATTIPTAWNPALEPVLHTEGDPEETFASLLPLTRVRGLRPGAPTRAGEGVPALASGPGPWWVAAGEGDLPRSGPVVLVLDGSDPAPPRAVASGATLVYGAGLPFSHALDLGAFDAVVAMPGAWAEDAPEAEARAAAVAGFVRGGGLLFGPAPERDWPRPLGRHLGTAGRSDEPGAEGARSFGLGTVVRTVSPGEALEVLATVFQSAHVSTLFDRSLEAPSAAVNFPAWEDDPAGRRTGGALLLAYVAALLAFEWILRGVGARLLGVLLSALAVTAGLAWASPAVPGFRVAAIAIDLGGGGGRRVEAVRIAAGPAGFLGPVRFRGGGCVRLLSGAVDASGNVRLPPGGTAWVVRETVGRGVLPGDVEDREAGFLRAFVKGLIDPKRARYGQLPGLDVDVAGTGSPPAWTLTYR